MGASSHTMPVVDSPSPRRRSGERVRERGFQLANSIEGAPLPSPLPARASRGEGAGGGRGGKWYRNAPAALTFLWGLSGASAHRGGGVVAKNEKSIPASPKHGFLSPPG